MPRTVSRRWFAGGLLTVAAASAETVEAPLAGEAQRQYQAILERHGNQLSDMEKADIRRLLALAVKGVEPLRAFPLGNADEPATVFHVWRAEGS
ncbi:MAG: hypothetical protein ABSF98_06300 [Bryobacteraceae bacterium]